MGVSVRSSVLLILLGIFGYATRSECALAAMSVDLGSQFIKVGLVKPGVPMEIVLNKESRRKTPSVLSIRNGERLFGDPALGLNVRYPKTVYPNLLDLLSKNIDHPSVELYRKRHPHLVVEKSQNSSSVVVPFGDALYSVESLLAMILSNLKEFTEAYAEQSVKDVVVTVPVYFTQAERLAIEKATQIARLNLLQLINDGTAVALNYGVFRRKEITEKPSRMLIYDMGSSKTTVTIVEYKVVKEKYGKEPKLVVLGVGYDRYLGGLEMTLRLQEHLVKRFRESYKFTKDITTNDRAMGKMLKESERLKQVLSANADHFAQIESVHEDIDMKIRVSRDEFTSLIADYDDKISKPIEDALKMAELNLADIDQVALFGAGTRVPKVQEAIQNAVGGKELGKFLNTDEAAAMGAVFLAAHLSSGFKVKPFNVEDLVIYPIQVKFTVNQQQENGDTIQKDLTRQIFQYKTKYPTNKKTIGFTSFLADFNFELNYGDLSHFNAEQRRLLDPLTGKLATISVDGLTQAIEEKVKPEETEFKGVKVPFILDGSGIVRVGKAEATIQRKSQGVVESITNTISGFFTGNADEGSPSDNEERKTETDAVPGTPDTETASEPTTDEEKGDNEQKPVEPVQSEKSEKTAEESEKTIEEAQFNATETTSTNETEKAEKKVPEIEKVILGTEERYLGVHILTSEEIEEYKTRLEAFERTEKLAAERAAAENELESFAFEASLLPDEEDFKKFSSQEEKEKLAEEVTRIRAWLEDETTPETKTGEFKENLNILKDILGPIKKRISESTTLPEAITNLENMLNSSRIMVGMGGDDEKALFNKNDTEAFAKKLDKLQDWIESKKSAQSEKKFFDEPAVLTSEVALKIKALDRELNRFMKKMKAERTVNMEKNQNKTDNDETTRKQEKTDEAEEQKPNSQQTENSEDNKEAKETEKVEL